MDPTRKLWFLSDFPNIIKTIWTRELKNKTLKVEPIVDFVSKINSLVDVLNSNTGKHGLQVDPKSNSYKVDIIVYLLYEYIFRK